MSAASGGPGEVLLVVGLSRQTAPLEVRERAALDAGAARSLLRALSRSGEALQALVLSTCNRTEVYAVVGGELAVNAPRAVRAMLGSHTRITSEELERWGYVRWQHDAIEHLFAITAGLQSTVLGETEIVAQTRAAGALADEEGALGPLLDGLLQHALAAGRRVRSATAIARGATSISSVAIELADELLNGLAGRRTLVVGAGGVASAIAHRLVAGHAAPPVVSNRSELAAAALARSVGGRAVPLSALPEELRRCHLLVCATAARGPVISRRVLAAATQHRDRPLVVIDLAVPRDVEPAAHELRGVTLRDIDDVQRIAAANLDERRRELPRARLIVGAEARRFETWRTGLEAEPLLRELRRSAEEIRRRELERLIARSPELDDAEIRRLDMLTRSVVNRFLHEPTLRIRRAGATASGRELLRALNQLFEHTSSDGVTLDGAREERSAA